MSSEVLTFTIALCGPGDVHKEISLAEEVISEWNSQHFESCNFGIKSRHWKTDVVPSMDARGQSVINRELIDSSDMLVAVFWRRFGTPTGMYDSGTAEEVSRAIARSIPVLLYFSDLEAPMVKVDSSQDEKLRDFREKAMNSGLPWSFRSRKEFKKLFARHLNREIAKFLQPKNKKESSISSSSPITQSAVGSDNVQVTGDGNTFNFPSPSPHPKIKINAPEGSLSPLELQQIQDWIEELSILMETVHNKTVKRCKMELWARLKNKFKVPRYELIQSSDMQEVEGWYCYVRAEIVRGAKRKKPSIYSGPKIRAIKAAMSSMGVSKEDYYPEIAARLKMRVFTSIKDLNPKNLEKVCNLVKRDSRRK